MCSSQDGHSTSVRDGRRGAGWGMWGEAQGDGCGGGISAVFKVGRYIRNQVVAPKFMR